jgi:hypothetical protein
MNNGGSAIQRYVPLACWAAVVLTALFICLKIVSYGFMPPGDARRHVAKPFAHKPYSQIVVMRPEYVVDHSPGWEWFLGALHNVLGWGEDGLMSFSIVILTLCVLLFPVIWMRHPEAWPAAVLAQSIAIPSLMNRWTQGRPYLLTEGIVMATLLTWARRGEPESKPSWPKLALTTFGIALSVWMHGAWYLWVLVLAAFFLAQRWRAACWLAACWFVGTIAGALVTGKPLDFLYGAIFMAKCVYQEHAPPWMLVGEFQPSDGEFFTVATLAIIYLWRRSKNKPFTPLHTDPVLWLMVISWILGMLANRFWADWGMPATVVWMACEFDQAIPELWSATSLQRLVACAVIMAPLYLISVQDLGRRYTASGGEPMLDASQPEQKSWMPGSGGIFYADNMQFFYNTFYKNPRGDWRYIVGFEPALMPADDLKVYRDIHRTDGAPESYEPWIKKMRPQDRVAVTRPDKPDIPALEWKQVIPGTWIGRLPTKDELSAPHAK